MKVNQRNIFSALDCRCERGFFLSCFPKFEDEYAARVCYKEKDCCSIELKERLSPAIPIPLASD
jgi:hypothetical protein